MSRRIFLWSLTSALAGFLFGPTLDLHVQPNSRGINQGVAVEGTLDFAGNSRVQGSNIDIGATSSSRYRIAVAMISHGPVITVAFIGYMVAGVADATAAALGIFLPIYLIVVLLAPHTNDARRTPSRMRSCELWRRTTGAIAGAVIVLARRSVCVLPTILICAVSYAVLFR